MVVYVGEYVSASCAHSRGMWFCQSRRSTCRPFLCRLASTHFRLVIEYNAVHIAIFALANVL